MVKAILVGRLFDGPRNVEQQIIVDLDEKMLDSLKEFEKGIRDVYAWGYADEIFHCLGKLAGLPGGQYTGYKLI